MTLGPLRGGVVRRRTVVAGVLALALLTACGGDDEADGAPKDDARALTSQEAELLALARFRMHQAETVPVEMEWPGEPSIDLAVTLDLHDGVGWGRMSTGDEGERLVLWNLQAVGTAPAGDSAPEAAEWATRALSTSVPQDIFLTLALSLGSDRPENPVLLQQSTARFLRNDKVNGVKVAVIQGPRPADETDQRQSRSRYWIAEDGALLRFEAYLGDRSGRLAQITVTDAHDEVAGLRDAADQVLLAGQRSAS